LVEFKIKINAQQRLAYIPKEIIEAMGLEYKLVGNRAALVMYPEKTSLEDVVKSLEILLADFHHAIEMQGAALKKKNEEKELELT